MRSTQGSRNVRKRPIKRRRKRGFGRFIFLVVLIVLLVVGGLTALKYLSGDSYDSEKTFEKYAGKYFKEAQESDKVGKSTESFKYGAPVSVASNYPKLDIESLDKKIKDTIDKKDTDFEGEYESEDLNKKFAQLTAYDSYESKKGTGSVVLKTVEREESDRGKLTQKAATVETFTFSIDKGIEIYPMMAFEPGYQEKLSNYLEEYLQDNHGDDLAKNWKKAIDPDENKFDKYALTKGGAIFYFDSGTVTKGNEILAVEVDEDDVKGVFREEVNARALDPSKPMVALTYDDGPAAGTSDRILDAFEKGDAVATFFELGENVANVKDSEKILKRMQKLGCEIGSHSWSHPNLFKLSDEKVKEQNDKTDKVIEEKSGQKPTVYRPPYGNGNDKITNIFNKPGILWSVDTLDWHSRNADSIVNVVKNAGNLDGKVVLMHSLYDSSAEATEKLIPWLQSEGYQLVTVSELLMYKYNEDPTLAKFYGYNYFYLDK